MNMSFVADKGNKVLEKLILLLDLNAGLLRCGKLSSIIKGLNKIMFKLLTRLCRQAYNV